MTIGSPNRIATSGDRVGSARVYETSVIQRGDFPVTVRIHLDDEPSELRWYIERLDTASKDTVIVASFPERSYVLANEIETEIVSVVEGGVFRFFIHRQDMWSSGMINTKYDLFLSDSDDEEQKVASGLLNGTVTFAESSFVANSLYSPLPSQAGDIFVSLALAFDQRPGDVHWVLLEKELILNNSTNRLENKRTILSFGPEQVYEPELAGSSLTHTIDVSSVSKNAEILFIFSDTGRDGMCCANGAGSYKLYKGTSTENEQNLLFSGSAKDARRAVHSFAPF